MVALEPIWLLIRQVCNQARSWAMVTPKISRRWSIENLEPGGEPQNHTEPFESTDKTRVCIEARTAILTFRDVGWYLETSGKGSSSRLPLHLDSAKIGPIGSRRSRANVPESRKSTAATKTKACASYAGHIRVQDRCGKIVEPKAMMEA